MSLTLNKGSSLPLTKEDGKTALTKIRVELSWNPNTNSSAHDFDLDVLAVVAKNETLQAVSQEHIAYFGQEVTPAINVSPDNRTGEGEGVDEFLDIDLTKVPTEGDRIPVLVYIYDAFSRNQSFAQVDGAKVVIRDLATNKEIGSCNISEKGSSTDVSLLVGVVEKQAEGSFVYKQENVFFAKGLSDWVDVFTS